MFVSRTVLQASVIWLQRVVWVLLQQWTDQMTAAVQPFIPDHGQQFAQHLLGFLASKLSTAGYDRLLFGEAASPNHALLQLSPGGPPTFPVCICACFSCTQNCRQH